MSYARFGPDSDVYVFLTIHGVFECCACGLTDVWQRFDTTDALLAHLDEHEAAGHNVPARCRERLINMRDENDAWIRGRRDTAR